MFVSKTQSLFTRLAVLACSFGLLTSASLASAQRRPMTAKASRETSRKLDTYHTAIEVVRSRSLGKTGATFSAEPQLLDANASALVMVRSVSATGKLERFRCIATHDIAECLGRPVNIRYLPHDLQLVLSVELIPRVVASQNVAVASTTPSSTRKAL